MYSRRSALAAGKTIATITHDCADFVTQPWVVMVGDVEIHRADTWVILPIDSTQQQADQKLSLSCGVTIPPKRSMPPRKKTNV